MNNRKLVAVAVMLSLLCGAVVAVVTVGLVQASWPPFHAETLKPVEEALQRERGEHQAELESIQQETDAAVAAVAEDSQFATGENTLLNDLIAEEAARDAAVAAVEQEKAALAVVISERDSLKQRVEQMRAQVPEPVPVAPSQANAAADPKQRQRETGLPVEITNSIGMKFVVIPAGQFSMGSATGDSDEQPVHQVTISKPFYLAVHEVTNANGVDVKGFVPSKWKGETLPIESVTWYEAQSFCSALSRLPAERAAGRVYRLPTEAEWEYACRAGTTTAYSFGDDESLLGDFAWFEDNAGGKTHPVGQKKPNPWGLYDMHGNVWEWCSDWYGNYASGAVTDPQPPLSGSLWVLRGGSWGNTARGCRSASRVRFNPLYRYGYYGFRLALSPLRVTAGGGLD